MRNLFSILDVEGLTDQEVKLLYHDVRSIVECEEAYCFSEAEKILRQRIGGQKNLRSYVDCLKAGPWSKVDALRHSLIDLLLARASEARSESVIDQCVFASAMLERGEQVPLWMVSVVLQQACINVFGLNNWLGTDAVNATEALVKRD